MRTAPLSAVIGILALAAGLAACNSGTTSAPAGTVRVNITDAPIDLTGVTAVNVTVSDVLVYPTDGTSDEGGEDLSSGPISVAGGMTINLLDYRGGKVAFLASGEVTPGPYQRVRLVVDSAEIVRDDDGDPATPDIVESVFVPSGKVDVPIPFAVSQDAALEITLDFDAQASVQVNETPGQHKYILRPVITPAGMKTL